MKRYIWIPVLLLLAYAGIVWFNQHTIMHPNKRLLQEYHKEWLNHPQKHSMKIEKHSTVDGIPYLIVKHNPSLPNSKRKQSLLKQLIEKGVSVENLKQRAVLVLLHGKNGRKEDLLPVAERYMVLGFTCVLPDLPLHGESKIATLYYGTIKSEQHYVDSVLDDALAYIGRLDKLSIWGMSLGGAFALRSVTHSKYRFDSMVLVSTFDRLDGVLKDKSESIFGSVIGSFLYRGLELGLDLFYDFDPRSANSAKLASEVKTPLYMMHGEKDELISIHRGEVLFKSFGSSKKRFVRDKDGDHHNILVTSYPFYLESGLFLLGTE